MLTTGRAPMNFMPGRSGVSNPRRLLGQTDESREVLASKGESERQCPIIRRSRDSLCAGFFEGSLCTSSPLSLHNFLFFGGGSSRGSSRYDSEDI